MDTAFWFTFANYDKPAARDLASYGVVRLLGESRWEPKQVFHATATRYHRKEAKRWPFPSSARAQG